MDVDYSISGSSAIAPIQVFDDGQRTYIQFPNPARIPEVRIENALDHSVIRYQTMAPYIVLNQVVDRIALKSAGHTVEIAYNRYRAPVLAGAPATRRQPNIALAAQPLTAPVAFYAAERPQPAVSHHKERHPAKGKYREESDKDAGPTAISVVSAASLAPPASHSPALPALPAAVQAQPLPGMHDKRLPALPGNIATLPQLHPYKIPGQILALNASPASAHPMPALPAAPAWPASPGRPEDPILAATGGAASATGATTHVSTEPGILAQAAPPSMTGAVNSLRSAAAAPPDVIPASIVHPGAPLAALADAAIAPAQSENTLPAGSQPALAAAAAAAAAQPPTTAEAKSRAILATRAAGAKTAEPPHRLRLAQAAEKPHLTDAPAAKAVAKPVPAAPVALHPVAKAASAAPTVQAASAARASKDAKPVHGIAPPVTRLALARPRDPIPALDVTAPVSGQAPQRAMTAAPAKPPVRHDYEIQPGLLKQAFRQVVEHYGYTLSWEVNEVKDKYVFDYPVAMAGTSFIDDLRSLEDMANAPKKAFVVDVYQGNKIITVRGIEN